MLLLRKLLSYYFAVHFVGGLLALEASIASKATFRRPFVPMNTNIHGVSEIIDQYDSFLIDQWGVLHDGTTPYEGVLQCLSMLAQRNKKMILLSNSSRRKTDCLQGLRKVGIEPDLFMEIITSGEIGWQVLSNRRFQAISVPFEVEERQRPLKAYVIGNGEEDYAYIQSANISFAGPEEADIIVARGTFAAYIHGVENPLTYKVFDDLITNSEALLQVAAARNLPMLVTNPDTMRPGTNSPMPGQVAAIYHALTKGEAQIEFIGKPHPQVYQACLNLLKNTAACRSDDSQKICCIGDSLEHDIRGAVHAGLDSLWIVNGVHCHEMNTFEGAHDFPTQEKMKALIDSHGIQPMWRIPTFRW